MLNKWRTWRVVGVVLLPLAMWLPLAGSNPVDAAGAVDLPSAVQRRATVTLSGGVSADVTCWLSGHVMSLPDKYNPESVLMRFVSVSTLFHVNQVMLNHSRLNGPVDIVASTALRIEAANLSPSIAKIYAAKTLGETIPPVGDEIAGPFIVEVRPREGLTWGDVATAADIVINAKGG